MINIEIDRLTVSVHGVSSLIVEEAVAGLEDELRRRLDSLPVTDMASFDMASLAIGPVPVVTGTDAASLRSLIVERLLHTVFSPVEEIL